MSTSESRLGAPSDTYLAQAALQMKLYVPIYVFLPRRLQVMGVKHNEIY
jgi:hypothetical protein